MIACVHPSFRDFRLFISLQFLHSNASSFLVGVKSSLIKTLFTLPSRSLVRPFRSFRRAELFVNFTIISRLLEEVAPMLCSFQSSASEDSVFRLPTLCARKYVSTSCASIARCHHFLLSTLLLLPRGICTDFEHH